jgi:class 3 adenylate cyclase
MVELARATSDTEAELRALVYQCGDLHELGRVAEGEQVREAFTRGAERLRQPYYLWWAGVLRVTLPLLQGRFDEAERLVSEALALGQRAGNRNALQVSGAQMFALRFCQGRLDELVDVMESFAGQYAMMPSWRCGLAFLYAELGRSAQARAELEHLAINDFRDIPVDIAWLSGLMMLTLACGALEDRRRAAILYARLLPCAGRIVLHPAAIVLGSAELPLGLLAATLGRFADAERHYERALAANTRLGARPFVARTQYHWAATCLARGGPADRARALELLNAALATGQELGMKALVAAALALKLRVQGVASGDRQLSIDAVLSRVERERPDLRRHAAPDGTVTIMFADIECPGALPAPDLPRAHDAAVREQVRALGGFEVESQGDGFMFAFASARRALLAAAAIQRALAAVAPRQGDPIRVRIGLHSGEAAGEADELFAKNVVLSARIAGAAEGGEILVSSLVKHLTESAGDFRFGPPRDLALAGLAGMHVVHQVLWVETAR